MWDAVKSRLQLLLGHLNLSKQSEALNKLEETLAKGVENGKVPYVVVFATNADGSLAYNHAVGKQTYTGDEAIQDDAVFLIASQSKLLTTIAVLQIVEKGLISLDDDVAGILPELGAQKILKGFNDNDNDEPILEARKGSLTLRHLLTHSSGIGYDLGDLELMKWRKSQGQRAGTGTTVVDRYSFPLLFEPGTAWTYGASMDWAGKLLERLTGMALEDYEKKHMWEPLGITEITFWPDQHPHLKARIPTLTTRMPDDSGLAPFQGRFINDGLTDCCGGQGNYASLRDYIKVQRSILANDGRLLRPETVDMMFQPQLTEASARSLNHFVKNDPSGAFFVGEFKPEIELNWGLGGILFMNDDEGRRRKGTLCWSGYTNMFWTIDPEAGVALTFGTQVVPPGDKKVEEVINAVEYAIFEAAGAKS